ncbi:hypothetical protein [Pseudomonas sp. B19125]|uniref:hypothetical protein n=1 Tax=Pseudomonas sp. B19125 TaxID=3235109 RepID=UPI0037844517
MNQIFSGILRPLPGEIFSSWLLRGVKSGDKKLTIAASILEHYEIHDPDVDQMNKAIDLLSKPLACSRKVLLHLFPAPFLWLPHQSHRTKYCASCIAQDFSTGHLAYRTLWLHRWMVGCPFHLHPLSFVEHPVTSTNQTLELGLLAVASENTHWGKFTFRDVLRASSIRPELGCFLIALYFQRWLISNFKGELCVLPNGQRVKQVHFLQILEAASLTLLDPYHQDISYTNSSATNSFSRKPFVLEIQTGTRKIATHDLARYDPLHISTLFAIAGLFFQIPACVTIWKTLRKNPIYQPSLQQVFFLEEKNKLDSKIIDMLRSQCNPFVYLVEEWISRPGVEKLRPRPFLFMQR